MLKSVHYIDSRYFLFRLFNSVVLLPATIRNGHRFQVFFLKKWAIPDLFIRLFLSFQTTDCYNKYMWKMPIQFKVLRFEPTTFRRWGFKLIRVFQIRILLPKLPEHSYEPQVDCPTGSARPSKCHSKRWYILKIYLLLPTCLSHTK